MSYNSTSSHPSTAAQKRWRNGLGTVVDPPRACTAWEQSYLMLIFTKFGSGSPTVSPNPPIRNYYLRILRTQIGSPEGKIRVDHIQSTRNPNKNELRHLYDFLPTLSYRCPICSGEDSQNSEQTQGALFTIL